MKNELQCYVKLSEVKIDQADLWVSCCPELDLFSQGGSEEEARASLKDAIALYLKYYPNEKEQVKKSLKNRKYFTVEFE